MPWPKLWSSGERAELARLRESEARYRMLADSATDLIIQYDLDGVIQYASPSAAAFGFRPEDLVGRSTLDFFHPDDVAARKARLDGLRRGDALPRGASNERRVRAGDGGWRWVQGSPTVVRDAAGAPIGAVTILRDVTTQRALADRLAAKQTDLEISEARYRALTDSAGAMIVQYDPEGVVRYASPAVSILGYRPEEVVGRPSIDFVHPDDKAEREADFGRLVAGQVGPEGIPYERRLRHKDGSYLWTYGSIAPIRGRDGELQGVVAIMRDATQKRALEAEVAARQAQLEEALARLSASDARYRVLEEHLRDVVIQYDAKGIVQYVSPSVALLGYQPADVVGRQIAEFGDGETGQPILERLASLAAGRPLPGGRDNEFRVRRADGSFVWMQGNPMPILDPAGARLGIVSVLRDVEEQRALEAELRARRAEAEAAVQAKAEFLANMSHEIRTPLTAVVGFAGLIAKMAGLPEKARVYVDRIARSGQALTSIVNNVLDFSKVEAGQVELQPEPFEIRGLVAEILGQVHDDAVGKGLTLGADIADATPRLLDADAGRIRQVLLNLTSNAVKFTREGGVRIEVGYEPGRSRLRVAVADTGIGVPEDLADRLFQRFSQIDGSNARRFGGVGLGLAISKGLVELMGGEIGVTSRAGEGSTFWFEIPAPAGPEAAAPPEPDEEDLEVAPVRVLVVDDARPNRELITALLGPFNLEITEAADGLEAVARTQRESYDLVLMDLQMPGMDGMAATRAIREGSPLNRATPIVAVSASVLPADVEACRAAGMNDHIPKPINPRELIGKVAHWTSLPEPPAPSQAA